jgi:hypothetical protein
MEVLNWRQCTLSGTEGDLRVAPRHRHTLPYLLDIKHVKLWQSDGPRVFVRELRVPVVAYAR